MLRDKEDGFTWNRTGIHLHFYSHTGIRLGCIKGFTFIQGSMSLTLLKKAQWFPLEDSDVFHCQKGSKVSSRLWLTNCQGLFQKYKTSHNDCKRKVK